MLSVVIRGEKRQYLGNCLKTTYLKKGMIDTLQSFGYIMLKERTFTLFWVETSDHFKSTEVKNQNPCNKISEGKMWMFSCLVHGFVVLRERSLLLLAEVAGHRSQTKNLAKMICQGRELGYLSYLACRCNIVRK